MNEEPADDVSAWDPNVLPPVVHDPGEPGSAEAGSHELVLLATSSMRARRRPLAILLLWAWQVVLAALVALPAASVVTAWYGGHPSGDAPLWQPGSLPLADLLLTDVGARHETVMLAGLVFLLAGFADLFPLAALLGSLAYVTRDLRPPPLRAIFGRAAAAFSTFATLFAMASLLEGLLVAVAFGASSTIARTTQESLGDARADQTGWLVGLAVLGLAATVGVLHDLARAGAIRFRVRALRAWRLAFDALARAPASCLWSWAWRAGAGWVPVGIGALVAARVGGHGGAQLAVLFFVHQLVLVVRVAFRASWLAKALRTVDRAHRVVSARRG